MTQAICFNCGELKHGAFTLCSKCHSRPSKEEDLIHSLCLTDHYFSLETLLSIGKKIQGGEQFQFEPKLVEMISKEVHALLQSPMGMTLMGKPPIHKKKKWWQFWT